MVAMRVTILAPGSRGDIQPYIALGQGLRAAGHQPVLVTTLDHEALVWGYGLEVRAVPVNVAEALREAKTTAAVEGGGVVSSFREFARIAKQAARSLAEVGLDAARESQVIVAGFSGVVVAGALGAKLGVPVVQAFNVPLTPTAAFPSALFPGLDGALTRALGHRLTRAAIWATSRASNDALVEVLGARPLGLLPPGVPGLIDAPLLYGFSEAFLARGPEWPSALDVTGFWFVREPSTFAPPEALARFLDEGPPPVCIGFGSMSTEDPQATTALVLEAARRVGVRVVLLSGWAGLSVEALPPGVFVLEGAPHEWLYPRCAAVVHHGGAGTTAAALRAGVPAVVVPFHGDQPFWGSRVAASGLGPPPLPRKKLSVERLAHALTLATTDAGMQERARGLSARLATEDGVGRAVERIIHFAGR